MPSLLKFADSEYDYSDAYFVIFGVPFDGTTSFRPGSRYAPNSIRVASKNLESFVYWHKKDMREARIHDMGDLEEMGNVEDVVGEVRFTIEGIFRDGKFPIMLGGEHSITAGVPNVLGDDVVLMFIDAHSDFRDEYLGLKYSHACVARRSFEVLGEKRVISIGVRSVSLEEYSSEYFKKFMHIPSWEVHSEGIESIFTKIEDFLKGRDVYLSIDMDGIDPAFAPGVATPEPMGLTPWDVAYIINNLGKRMVGADIVEISPPFDNGITSMLGAKLVQEIISAKS
ncbi:MAG: agmatinase [Thermoplasmata archaeon]